MAVIRLNGTHLNVDIEDELSQFEWARASWRPDKLIAASPFRYDTHPSFVVFTDGEYAGVFKDSGAYDADFESGNLAKLLAFLRDETYEETVDYLFEVYGVSADVDTDNVAIPSVSLHKPKERIVLSGEIMNEYMYRHPYLSRRYISEKVQRFMGVGYDRKSKAIAIPWRHPDGKLANMKFRKVRGKTFWYRKGSAPVRSLVYGIDKVYKHDLRDVYVCEAEIDVMSCYELGLPAIAIGGASVSKEQLDIIRSSPIERIIIAVDNDKPGKKVRDQIAEGLRGHVGLSEVVRNGNDKDINDLLRSGNGGQIKETAPVSSAAFRIQLR